MGAGYAILQHFVACLQYYDRSCCKCGHDNDDDDEEEEEEDDDHSSGLNRTRRDPNPSITRLPKPYSALNPKP